MSPVLKTLVLIAMAAVVIVLTLGLWNMMKGGSANRSQKLMRLRGDRPGRRRCTDGRGNVFRRLSLHGRCACLYMSPDAAGRAL